jgi:hypothetical protein
VIETLQKLELLLSRGERYFNETSLSKLNERRAPGKWSEKEILGHLIDSAVNNLQRFTEIQFEPKPYRIRKYNQDELVRANQYQDSELSELLALWISLNQRIVTVIRQQDSATLNYPIELPDGSQADFRFLIQDYADHLEHHLKQLATN